MTVRPRYTARMKARDLAVGYGVMLRASAPILQAGMIVLRALVRGTVLTITTRYTNPREEN